ncbi:MAG: 5'-3' exonuclease [Acidimicrobiales bacterium]
MKVHLVDGTYELFRHHFGRPPRTTAAGTEVAATHGVLASLLDLVEGGATHLGVATDHVIESFRNAMWPGYKSGEGVAPELLAQFPMLEEALRAMGVVVWAMVDLEADDALASAAAVAAMDPRVDQVLVCTPDKDLAQVVVGERVVQLDRRRRDDPAAPGAAGLGGRVGDGAGAGPGGEAGPPAARATVTDEAGVWARYGVGPASIPDWLALVGDSSDGFPGLPGWGPKSAAAVLARYRHLEAIPDAPGRWEVTVRGGARLAATLAANRERAGLFRDLATLRIDRDLLGDVEDLRWRGPGPAWDEVCAGLEAPRLAARARALAAGTGRDGRPGAGRR